MDTFSQRNYYATFGIIDWQRRTTSPHTTKVLILVESSLLSSEREKQLLNAMMKSIGINKNHFRITDTLDNIDQQITEIEPQLLLACGEDVGNSLLKTNEPLKVLREQQHCYGEKQIPVVVTHSPAYLLQHPEGKREAFVDLRFIIALLNNLF